jgi:phage tail sheath protein FI
VEDRVGHGVICLRGIDTTGDQISVTRVADIAIRETKDIAENFIGELNSDQARLALKQQIVATFTRMEREGALVPSTDGKDPAFLVDVYSTQLDFAQGTVRIDIAIRPVRAIDYIYATIRVKN